MRKRTTTMTPAQPPREWFHSLLLTWTILHPASSKRYIDREALGRLPRHQMERKCIELENKYGVGHYEDRRDLLESCLKRLEGNNKTSLHAVFHALNEAYGLKGNAFFEGRGLDAVRDLFTERDLILKHLRRWLSRTERLYKRCYSRPLCDALSLAAYHGPAPAGVTDIQLILDKSPIDVPLLTSLRAFAAALDRDPLTILERPSRLRRPRRGHQPEPWLKQVRLRLRDAGVEASLREDLLVAVGFIPYRSS